MVAVPEQLGVDTAIAAILLEFENICSLINLSSHLQSIFSKCLPFFQTVSNGALLDASVQLSIWLVRLVSSFLTAYFSLLVDSSGHWLWSFRCSTSHTISGSIVSHLFFSISFHLSTTVTQSPAIPFSAPTFVYLPTFTCYLFTHTHTHTHKLQDTRNLWVTLKNANNQPLSTKHKHTSMTHQPHRELISVLSHYFLLSLTILVTDQTPEIHTNMDHEIKIIMDNSEPLLTKFSQLLHNHHLISVCICKI